MNIPPPASGAGNLLRCFPVLLLAVWVGGCAAVATLPTASSLLPASTGNASFYASTVVRLEQGNFLTLKTNLMGHSQGFALLGLITLYPAKFTKALDGVYAQSEMKTGHSQTLVNVVTERSSTYWILFSIPKVSIRADLVEFKSSPGVPPGPVPP
jgi:hypothetical protein